MLGQAAGTVTNYLRKIDQKPNHLSQLRAMRRQVDKMKEVIVSIDKTYAFPHDITLGVYHLRNDLELMMQRLEGLRNNDRKGRK